jgi:hypothetical protein
MIGVLTGDGCRDPAQPIVATAIDRRHEASVRRGMIIEVNPSWRPTATVDFVGRGGRF